MAKASSSKLWKVTIGAQNECSVLLPPRCVYEARIEAHDERHALRGIMASMPAKAHLELINGSRDDVFTATFATKHKATEATLFWDHRTRTLEIQP